MMITENERLVRVI